jgi:hypothetical protein
MLKKLVQSSDGPSTTDELVSSSFFFMEWKGTFINFAGGHKILYNRWCDIPTGVITLRARTPYCC